MRRATQVTIEVLSGEEVLLEGMETARLLWNELRHGLVGFNHWLARCRGHKSLAGRLPPYPGNFGIQKVMSEYSLHYKNLSDRCASYTVKDFDIAMRSWFSNLKSNPQARPPRKCYAGRTLTFEVGRNAKPIGNFEYRLTVLGGKREPRHTFVRIHVKPGVKMAEVKLIRVKSRQKRGRFEGSLILLTEDVEPQEGGIAALDLGIINLGGLVFEDGDSILYNGRALLDVLRFAEKRAAKCKPSGWEPGKSRLPASERKKAYQQKAANITHLAIHNFTRDVIRQCLQRGVGTLVVGNLTGIREGKDFGKAGNQKFHRWPQGEIRRQLHYKGEEVGIEVVEISEAYTSQACCQCGVINKASRVKRGLYHCQDCGLIINADINGGLNMLHKVSPEMTIEGVGAVLPGPPSTGVVQSTAPEAAVRQGAGEVPQVVFANHPVFTAEFDLRTWSIVTTQRLGVQRGCRG